MLEDPVHHVGHGLEAPVGVPWGALRLTRRVLHLAHLIHVDERVQLSQINAGERATDREAFALEAAGSRGDRSDTSLGGPFVHRR
jgi:hypothetical protein